MKTSKINKYGESSHMFCFGLQMFHRQIFTLIGMFACGPPEIGHLNVYSHKRF